MRRNETKTSWGERLRRTFLKPTDPDAAPVSRVNPPRSLEGIQALAKSADDKERLIGLMAAPVAAAIGILVINSLIANDPPALLANGTINKLHVNVSIYHSLVFVLLGLCVVMLAMAWFRKRLYLGIVMALYGLAIFNLHYWGFGVPFVMIGAWLFVRAYRIQRELREATNGSGLGYRQAGNGRTPRLGRPGSNKRYTPPSSR